MDPNAKLARLRYMAKVAESNPLTDHGVGEFLAAFRDLDAHLSAGGLPPEAWREGPDAVGTETGPDPWRPEPLGGPIPGVAGSHLPDEVGRVLDERVLPPRRHLPERDDDYTPAAIDRTELDAWHGRMDARDTSEL